jgi:hypothetical protein
MGNGESKARFSWYITALEPIAIFAEWPYQRFADYYYLLLRNSPHSSMISHGV